MMSLSLQKHYIQKRVIVYNYKKENGCYVCGEKDPIVLDLHHTNNDKISDLKYKNGRSGKRQFYQLSWDKLYSEMEKCKVICANCHRKEHYWNTHKKGII